MVKQPLKYQQAQFVQLNFIKDFRSRFILCCKTEKLSQTRVYSVGFNHDSNIGADHDAEILCKRIT